MKLKGPYETDARVGGERVDLCPHIELLAKKNDFEYDNWMDVLIHCTVCQETHQVTMDHEKNY